MALQFTTSYIEDALSLFRYYKRLAERAMEQVTDEQLFAVIDKEANSIASHREAHGGQHALPLDRLPDDGWREARPRPRQRIRRSAGDTRRPDGRCGRTAGTALFSAIEPLTDADLGRTVTIRGEAHSVMQAINRQLAHYPHHVGQIVLLAKHFACDHWQSLSVPRNKSAEFNRKVAAGELSQR